MSYRIVLACAVSAWIAPALAQSPVDAPVGIGTCDTFLAAYERCAASPGVPEATRTALLGGIANMRSGYRDAAASSPQSREAVRQQCRQTHEMARASLVQALKCDFPAADAMPTIADLPPPPVAPVQAAGSAPSPISPEESMAEKANAYTAVQNDIVASHPMRKQLAEHVTNNERVLKLGTKLGANAWYLFGIPDFDGIIERLTEAMAKPGAVPEVDPSAQRLLAALQSVNPTIKALDRYQTTREFKEDKFKLAREQQPILVAGMKDAIAASDAFSAALFDRRMALDERQLQALPKDSLAQRLLATSLDTRRLIRRYDALNAPADVPPFLATLSEVIAVNKDLASTIASLTPKPDSACADYSGSLDALVGHGRDLARDVKTRGDSSQPSELFATAYNRSVDYYTDCRKNEQRARF